MACTHTVQHNCPVSPAHRPPDSRSVSRRVSIEEWDYGTSIQCIEHSMNKVVFEYFGGEQCQWGFLAFLLRMTRALKVVEFYCSPNKDWTIDQIEMIGHMNRASPDVEFLFFRSCGQVSNLYMCHCCPQRCHKENKVLLL